jgi:hypothetical protein
MRKLSPLVARGIHRHQIGDAEYRLLFEPALLGKVAQAVKARRRRIRGASPETLAKARANSLVGRVRALPRVTSGGALS